MTTSVLETVGHFVNEATVSPTQDQTIHPSAGSTERRQVGRGRSADIDGRRRRPRERRRHRANGGLHHHRLERRQAPAHAGDRHAGPEAQAIDLAAVSPEQHCSSHQTCAAAPASSHSSGGEYQHAAETAASPISGGCSGWTTSFTFMIPPTRPFTRACRAGRARSCGRCITKPPG